MVVVLVGVAVGPRSQVGPVDDDVLVDALGADEREVGLADQLVLGAQPERLGDAGRGGEGVGGLRGLAQALSELERAPRARVGQDDRELVAAHAVGDVRPAPRRPDGAGQGLQALVAGLVAVRVVDRLEVVDVDDHERQRHAGAGHDLQLAGHVLLEGAVVAQARERVGDRHLGQAPDLGGARGVEPAAVAHDDGAEEGEQQEADGDGEGDRPVRAGLVSAQRGALGQRAGARGGRLAIDDVFEDPEDRVDRTRGRRPARAPGRCRRPRRRAPGWRCDSRPGGAAGGPPWPQPRVSRRARARGRGCRSGAARPGGGRTSRRSCPRGGIDARSTSPRRPSGARPGRWRSGGLRDRPGRTCGPRRAR